MRRIAVGIILLAVAATDVSAQIHLGSEPTTHQYAIGEDNIAGMLTERFPKPFLTKHMMPRDEWRPFPQAADRDAWQKLLDHDLNVARKKCLVEEAEKLVGRPWPQLPATLYMEYARNGNRTRYQYPYFQRREKLSVLVMAECMEHEGRFIDEIANGIWAITEEATWCVPAHATRLSGDVLHRQDVQGVDIFACETAATLATALYLLQTELESISPALCDRVRREVMTRIILPVDEGHEFGRARWMDGHNNWSPWCASNIFAAALIFVDDPDQLVHLTHRLMVVVDRFINNYGDDGGCDEGPGYWNEAPGAMIVFLELLGSRTGGATDSIYTDPKIANMGLYIERARIAGPWFANFADAPPRSSPHPGKVYRYGQRVGSEPMKNAALLSMRNWTADASVDKPIRVSGISRPLLGPLMEIFWIPGDARPTEMPREREAWLPDLEVLYARESATSDEGLAIAAKGGHNAENHNHNDIGNFILLLDGQPAIIDIGAETYSKKTFSSDRYDIWCIRASGHNIPMVNGCEQVPGGNYRATDVTFTQDGDNLDFAMNLAEAYPKKAEITLLHRRFRFDRGKTPAITVQDDIESENASTRVETIMYSPLPVRQVKPGTLAIETSPRTTILEYESIDINVDIETVPLADGKLQSSWGDQLYRIRFNYATNKKKSSQTFRFSAE